MRLLAGDGKTTTVRVPIPLLARGDELITATGLYGQAMEMCRQIESRPSALAAAVNIGNPFTDVADLQSNAIVTTNGDAEEARQWAEELSRFMWRHRRQFVAQLVPLPEAVELAQNTAGLTVFSDAADSTASGASGDSNAILKGLLTYGYTKSALMPLVDAAAVEAAFGAGVGATIELPLGGSIDRQRFSPIDLTVYIKSLSDGVFTYEGDLPARAGRTAVLQTGKHSIVVTENQL